jgi:hypothetical protein
MRPAGAQICKLIAPNRSLNAKNLNSANER